jgi:hypothetical protein
LTGVNNVGVIPLTCFADEEPVGWPLDYSNGKLEFVDSGYTIPNHAVRFVDAGAFPLHSATFETNDIETINGLFTHEQREAERSVDLECQLLFGVNAAGSVYNDLQEGMITNWNDLTDLADLSVTTTSGLQTVRYTPYIGGPTHQFEAHVLPPKVGNVTRGIGMQFTLTIAVPNPTPLLP